MISELVKIARLSPGVFTISRVFALIISLLLLSAVSIAQEYPSLPVYKSYKLDSKLSENSGITFSNGKIYLCAYEGRNTYLTILSTGEYLNFSGEYTNYIIPELKHRQVESIFVKENLFYLASERSSSVQAIYKIILPGKK